MGVRGDLERTKGKTAGGRLVHAKAHTVLAVIAIENGGQQPQQKTPVSTNRYDGRGLGRLQRRR